jgi:hypothetical protein
MKNELLERATRMKERIDWAEGCISEGIERLPHFFQEISNLQDWLCEEAEKAPYLKNDPLVIDFLKFFESYGRNPDGWNPTRPGEMINSKNVVIRISPPEADSDFPPMTAEGYILQRDRPRGEIDHIFSSSAFFKKWNRTEIVDKIFVSSYIRNGHLVLRELLERHKPSN